MKAKSFLPWLLAAALVGCNNGASAPDAKTTGPDATATAAPKPAGKTLKVALLTPGPVSDSGWSAMAYEGLQGIKTELGAEVANQEATGNKTKESMRSYAQNGYGLVFGHGYEYNAPGVEVAKDFPNTVFVSSSGGATAKNAGAFRFELEQGFYLAGMVAGEASKSGKVAMIGGPDVPSIRSTFKAFRAGALAANPKATVIEIFTGKDSDIAAAKNAALSAIGQGADFVIHQANAAAQGVFDACKEKGVYAFGANADQNSNPSDVVIGSAVIIAKPAFVDLAKQVQAGTYTGSVQSFGMDKGAIDFVFNPKLQSKLAPKVIKDIDDARAAIKAGKLTVPEDKF